MNVLSSAPLQFGSYSSKVFEKHDKEQTQHGAVEVAEEKASKSGDTRLDISKEGREKLEQEQKALGKKIADQLAPKEEEDDAVPESKEIETLNKLIKEVQQRIKETQQKLSELDNDQSDESEAQRKALEGELITLNSTLMALISKKMEALEESAK